MRAFTDNDKWMRKAFYDSGLTQLRYHVRELKPATVDGRTAVRATVEVNGAKSAGFKHVAEYVFAADGSLEIRNDVTPFGKMPSALPRLGLSLMLDPRLERMEWYGRGPFENYVDRNAAAFLGRYASTVTDQYVPYVRPQDCGYKTDVRWVEFRGRDGFGVRFSFPKPLFVQALHYGWEDLEFARHRNHEGRKAHFPEPRKETCFNIDVMQTGLGGQSCGPIPMDKYICKPGKADWTVVISAAR